MDKQIYNIDGFSLTIDKIVLALNGKLGLVGLDYDAKAKCKKSRNQIEKWLLKDAPVVYGVNTGLGNLKDTVLSQEDHLEWNKTIPYPHAVGMGNYINPNITRAALLIRANVLSRGYSAVRPELIQRMLDIFNKGISPAIYELGSTGLSDLGPLAQSVMVVAGLDEAEVFYNGKKQKAGECFQNVGLKPVFPLECKEVLAQMNGSTMTQAIAVLACHNMQELLNIGKQIEKILNIEEFKISGKNKVYSDVEQAFEFILKIINFENNISCDNPLLFKTNNDNYEPVMGCNCSNTQVGYVLDLLSILVAEKSNFIYEFICMLEHKNPEINRSSIIVESIVREIKSLCIPASADSIPTKGNQEDHVEFSYGAARKAMKSLRLYKLQIAYFIDLIIKINNNGKVEYELELLKNIMDNISQLKNKNLLLERIKTIENCLNKEYFLIDLV